MTSNTDIREYRMEYRRLRAPRTDRGVLVEPAWDQFPQLLERNRALRSRYDYDFQGCRFHELVPQARSELIDAAIRWTESYRDLPPLPPDREAPVFLAGHQPQLFHPGVWLKNYALSAVGTHYRAWAINLLVDSDTLKSASVPVASGSPGEPVLRYLPLDVAGPPVPFEERPVVDHELFESFGRRATEAIAPLVHDPMIRRFWPLVVERAQATGNLGAALAQGRHRWEQQWEWNSLEVPQSFICSMPSHARFVVHLLAQLPRFHHLYNEALDEYRRVHRIRNLAQPAPNLSREDPWLEAPFWIWSRDDPRRRRLLVRRVGEELELGDGHHWRFRLALSPESDGSRAAEQVLELAAAGVKLRCRALITTLWARLVLGDVFIHGIGGAKYDQISDALIARFFGLRPPGFVTLSATLLLPVARPRVSTEQIRDIDHQLRALRFHAEKFVEPEQCLVCDGRETLRQLIAEKRRWIATPQRPENARQRYLAFQRINRALQPFVAEHRRRLLQRRSELVRALQINSVLAWREYAFCLYPEEMLRDFYRANTPAIETGDRVSCRGGN